MTGGSSAGSSIGGDGISGEEGGGSGIVGGATGGGSAGNCACLSIIDFPLQTHLA